MRHFASPTILALLSLLPSTIVAQNKRDLDSAVNSHSTKSTEVAEFDEAIETIASSTDSRAVNAAGAKLRQGGLPAIHSLVQHLNDTRHPPSNYLTRAVSGEVDMSDHSFWLIQGILETHTSKMDQSYSPLEKGSVAKWLADRKGMTLAHLRREACIGAFTKIFAMGQKYPDFDVQPVIVSYAKRLVELDSAIHSGG